MLEARFPSTPRPVHVELRSLRLACTNMQWPIDGVIGFESFRRLRLHVLHNAVMNLCMSLVYPFRSACLPITVDLPQAVQDSLAPSSFKSGILCLCWTILSSQRPDSRQIKTLTTAAFVA